MSVDKFGTQSVRFLRKVWGLANDIHKNQKGIDIGMYVRHLFVTSWEAIVSLRSKAQTYHKQGNEDIEGLARSHYLNEYESKMKSYTITSMWSLQLCLKGTRQKMVCRCLGLCCFWNLLAKPKTKKSKFEKCAYWSFWGLIWINSDPLLALY